jgi:hypothetical protein
MLMIDSDREKKTRGIFLVTRVTVGPVDGSQTVTKALRIPWSGSAQRPAHTPPQRGAGLG